MSVKPKKHFGQHFLRDENIARKITSSLTCNGSYERILEVGPGMGMLSKHLLKNPDLEWYGIELDKELVDYLLLQFPDINSRLKHGDFLSYDLKFLFNNDKWALIGSFPYNISSQIVLRALEYRWYIPEIVGMFQKEVAVRIASNPGSKTYGILSVFCQAFYDVEILFPVGKKVFYPPPNVMSAVIRMKIKNPPNVIKNEKKFFEVVKLAFNQRRKTLRNALKQLLPPEGMQHDIFNKRAEQLSVEDFLWLTNYIVDYK